MSTAVLPSTRPGDNVKPPHRTTAEIVSTLMQRRSADSAHIRAMIDARDRYNGDLVVPHPDVASQPNMQQTTARLLSIAIDGNALRAGSARANIYCPPTDVSSDRARRRAEDRRKAFYGAWYNSALDTLIYRSYRHLVGYGTCSFVVMPDDREGRARIEIRDPLTAYPELRTADDWHEPLNVGFVHGRSKDWILDRFPEAAAYIRDGAPGQSWDTLWDTFEWIDEHDVVIGILGPRQPAFAPQDSRSPGNYGFELRRFPNKAGMVPAAIPRRLTLDRVMGQLEALTGVHDLLARLNSLDILAAERHIFPDLVVLGEQGKTPSIVGGSWRDGRTGEANLLTDTRDAKMMQASPGPLTQQIIDRLERNIRVSGGVSPSFSGENDNSLRTGRALDTMGAFSIDPRIEEMHKIMARTLSTVNSAVAAVEKGYYPNRTIHAVTGWSNEDGEVTYTPSKVYDTDTSVVTYPFAGSDIAQVSINVNTLVATSLMSHSTGRRHHPWIEDPELEDRQIQIEQITAALSQGAAVQLTQPGADLILGVDIIRALERGTPVHEAVATAREASVKRAEQAQQQQAAAASGGGMPALGPGPGGPPALGPGGGGPGGPPTPPGATPAPTPSMGNFRQDWRDLSVGRGA